MQRKIEKLNNVLVDFPVLTGETLAPKKHGPARYVEVLSQVIACLPDKKRIREKRDRKRVPVPFKLK